VTIKRHRGSTGGFHAFKPGATVGWVPDAHEHRAVDANSTIFVASGAQQSGFPGHKPQQPLFMLDLRPHLNLTNCAAIFMAGQFGHSSSVETNAPIRIGPW